jgi:D-glycero-D-manno-heptose 1,7-bisphosphate phosphatase
VGVLFEVKRAVFLDRDGVINRAVLRGGLPFPPESVQDLEVLPGVPEALALLRSAGFTLVVVTNQPDVARGRQTRAEVEAIHGFLTRTLPLDAVKVCYHDDPDLCACRKPLPGMILEAAVEMSVDLSRSYMVGDRWKDIEAGERAGTTTILVENEYPEKKPGNPAAKVGSLREAAEWILAREKMLT